MYNILFIGENLSLIYKIVNYVSAEISNCRLYAINNTQEGSLKTISSCVPDIIIIDYNSKNISSDIILDYIEIHKLNKYYNSVINISISPIVNSKIIKRQFKSRYICISDNFYNLKKELQDIMNYTNITKIEKINNEMKKIKYNFSYVGTKYLSDCIYLCSMIRSLNNINLNKQIYPIIANKYHKSINSIKTNIIRATTNMYYDCDEETLSKFLGYKFIYKPSLKEIIIRIINNIDKV